MGCGKENQWNAYFGGHTMQGCQNWCDAVILCQVPCWCSSWCIHHVRKDKHNYFFINTQIAFVSNVTENGFPFANLVLTKNFWSPTHNDWNIFGHLSLWQWKGGHVICFWKAFDDTPPPSNGNWNFWVA